MSMVSHIEHLENKHAEFEIMLTAEMARPLPDFYTIKDIKKQKLLLKEEISRMMVAMMPHRKNVS